MLEIVKLDLLEIWKCKHCCCCNEADATLGIVFVFGHVPLVTTKHGVSPPGVKPTEASGPTH